MQVTNYLGSFLSVYDETVTDGLSRFRREIELSAEGATANADSFIAHPDAVKTMLGVMSRKNVEVGLVFDVLRLLMQRATKTKALSLIRALGQPRVGPIARAERILRSSIPEEPARIARLVAVLEFYGEVAKQAPRTLLAKFSGGKFPVDAEGFGELSAYAQRVIRLPRTELLLHLVNSKSSDVTLSVIQTPKFATALLQDLPSLMSNDAEAAQHEAFTVAVLERFGEVLVFASQSEQDRERLLELLRSQRAVTKTLIQLLGKVKFSGVQDASTRVLTRMVLDLREASKDYTSTRDDDNLRMPNYFLLVLLRSLLPKRRLVDAHLLALVLQKCPDLVRPYLVRHSSHFAETHDLTTNSVTRETVTVCTSMTRVFLSPLPYCIANGIATLIPSTASPLMHFELTPARAADECVPVWFREFFHRASTLKEESSNLLALTVLAQCTQAALDRVSRLLTSIHRLLQRQEEETTTTTVADPFFTLDYLDHFRVAVTERLPSHDDFVQITQRILAMLEGSERKPEACHFLLQRIFLLHKSYAQILGVKVPLAACTPRSLAPWQPDHKGPVALANWPQLSVRTLCLAVSAVLARGVKAPKLHSISFGDKTVASAPLLLEVLYWFLSNADRTEASRALSAIAEMFTWLVHSVSVAFMASKSELEVWLRSMNLSSAAVFLHVVNSLHQQSLSKVAERVTERLSQAEHGMLHEASVMFVERTIAKQETRTSSGGGETATKQEDPWQRDLRMSVADFQKTMKEVQRQFNRSSNNADTAALLPAAVGASVRPFDEGAQQRMAHTQKLVVRELPSARSALQGFFAQPQVLPFSDTKSSHLSTIATMEKTDLKHWPGKVWVALSMEDCGWLVDPRAVWQAVAALWNKAASSKPEHIKRCCAKGLADIALTTPTLFLHFENKLKGRSIDTLHRTGFALLLYVLALLFVRADAEEKHSEEKPIPLKHSDRISILLRTFYGGSLTLEDTLLYATMSMLDRSMQPVTTTNGNQKGKVDVDADAAPKAEEGEPATANEAAPGSNHNSKHALGMLRTARFLLGEVALQRILKELEDAEGENGIEEKSPRKSSSSNATTELVGLPEAEMLSSVLENWTDANIEQHALQMPLRLTTFDPTVHDLSALHPLGLLLPEVHHLKSDPNLGSSLQQQFSAPILGSVGGSSSVDPRYLLPLIYSVAALRARLASKKKSREDAERWCPKHLLTRSLPFALRGLSSADPSLRQLCANICGLVAPLQATIRRCLLLSVGVRMNAIAASRSDGGKQDKDLVPRVDAPFSAFVVISLNILSAPRHPLYTATKNWVLFENLNKATYAPRKSSSALSTLPFPMDGVLASFPSECLLGFPNPKATDGVSYAPHLRIVLTLLRNSVSSATDIGLWHNHHIVGKLCNVAGAVQEHPRLRHLVLDVMEHFARVVGRGNSRMHVVGRSLVEELALWLVGHIAELTAAARRNERELQSLATPVLRVLKTSLAVLHRLEPSITASMGAETHDWSVVLRVATSSVYRFLKHCQESKSLKSDTLRVGAECLRASAPRSVLPSGDGEEGAKETEDGNRLFLEWLVPEAFRTSQDELMMAKLLGVGLVE